tara:strand:+ start:124 stop:303 length:180 start_codon:yes stop_codon:yes gene_type:complete
MPKKIKLKPFKKLTVNQKIELKNIQTRNRVSDNYMRKLRGLVMKGKTIKEAQKKLRKEK